MKFIETLKNVWKIEELRNRIMVTLGLLLVYRFGAQVVLPGIDASRLAEFSGKFDAGGIGGLLNAFTGGAFANASVFAALFFGGTSLLIMVGVAIDTMQQINSFLLNRHYDGLMKTGKNRKAVV